MAFEQLNQKKIIATNLSNFIDSQIVLITQSRIKKDLQQEQNFNTAVINDNLDLSQQLDYRNNQLSKVGRGDKNEKLRIKKEINSLKKRIVQKNFTDKYIAQLTDLNSGASSLESTINWLNNTLVNTKNPDVRDKIKGNLSQLEGQLYEQRKNALMAQTKYALGDKSLTIIDKQIDNVKKAKSNAINSDNKYYADLLDLQLQGLNKVRTETEVSNSLLDFSVATVTGHSAISLLNSFNNEIANSNDNTPIDIGGKKYDSAKQFWELKQGAYLSDNSQNGFFDRYQQELKQKIDYKNSHNILTDESFKNVNNWYNSLKNRPELSSYSEQIDQTKQQSLDLVAKIRANTIMNDFQINQEPNQALKKLAFIQDTYGVDQTINYQKILMSTAKSKQEQVNQTLNTMQTIEKGNPALTNAQAMDEAIKSGSAASLSPKDLATKNTADIISGFSNTANQEKFAANSNTIDTNQNLKEGDFYKTPNDTTVYKYENGNLRPFTGSWNESQFQQATGKTFKNINELNSISGISKGEPITNTQNTLIKNQVGEKIDNPNLLQLYKPDQIVTKGQDKFLKPNVQPLTGKKLNPTDFSKLQQEYDPKTLESKIIRAGKDIYLKS